MSEKGQSLVEFSISLVMILILLAGAVEFGLATLQYIQLRDAAQEGALFGSICQDFTEVEKRARGASSSPIDLNKDVGVQIEPTDDGGIRVTMTYIHKVFMPFASVFVGEEILIKADVTNTILTKEGCK